MSKKAMILAAGLGTRLKPLTDHKPKALIQVKGMPLLEFSILKLKKYGFTDIVINVHHFAQQIIDFLKEKDNFGCHIQLSDERGMLLETGGGILHAAAYLKENTHFLIYNVDILSDLDLGEFWDFHVQQQALVSLAVKDRSTSRQLLFDAKNQLCGWRNLETGELKEARKPDGVLIGKAFSGIHILNSRIFSLMTENGKFSIIDSYLRLAATEKLLAFDHSNDLFFDMGRVAHIEAFDYELKELF